MQRAAGFLFSVVLAVLCPLLLLLTALLLALADVCWAVFGRRRPPADRACAAPRSASIVIPNWNGRDLLEKYLPSVMAAAEEVPGSEIIVVDNGSTDGSADFVRERYPGVRLLALAENRGFGGGSNAGVEAARNDVVVLLNSDMRVETGFLGPLLDGFGDQRVFAVACQIFLSDPAKRREETGLTQGAWRGGALKVRHRIDPSITGLYPCFYGGGGSCAFDRRKFLELGGFDALLRPFYLEDTDLGYLAWKRGWQVLYQPNSVVFHEHRGTIGRHFTTSYIQSVYKKNFVLFTWKNIHSWRKLAAHLAAAIGDTWVSTVFGDSPERTNGLGLARAFLQLPGALRSRWIARSLAVISDDEAFRRPLGGYFRDRFQLSARHELTERPRVLFVSPYALCPPIHGGAVFMYSTVRQLAQWCDVHLVCMLDEAAQRHAHEALRGTCRTLEFAVRSTAVPRAFGSAVPHAIREFASDDFDWLIHRQIFTQQIDVIQLEYTSLAQYAGKYDHIGTALFEHDVYFQSIARSLRQGGAGLIARFEYLRALRYELRALAHIDRVQMCHGENRAYVASFAPKVAARLQPGLRAGIEADRYDFRPEGREPCTMLFIGSHRHVPNRQGLQWFVREVLPRVLEREPRAKLVVVGSEIPPHEFVHPSIELHGFAADVREPLARFAVFVCPVLSGSGVRVKLLEAFASGIPTVSTPLGAEGLARVNGELCCLARGPAEFADCILNLFANPSHGSAMARRARNEVEAHWDSVRITRCLAASYRELLSEKRGIRAAETAAISS